MRNASPVEALGTKAMSEAAQLMRRAQDSRMRSMSSNQERKRVLAV